MMLASHHGYLDIVEILINAGANINLQDKRGYTALIWASFNGYKDSGHKEIVELFMKAGANVNLQVLASKSGSYLRIVELLLLSADKIQNNDMYTLHTEIVELFTKVGVSTETILLNASINGYIKIVELIIQKNTEYVHC